VSTPSANGKNGPSPETQKPPRVHRVSRRGFLTAAAAATAGGVAGIVGGQELEKRYRAPAGPFFGPRSHCPWIESAGPAAARAHAGCPPQTNWLIPGLLAVVRENAACPTYTHGDPGRGWRARWRRFEVPIRRTAAYAGTTLVSATGLHRGHRRKADTKTPPT
jgi:hypothetical protein